jgi:hypothetical protein
MEVLRDAEPALAEPVSALRIPGWPGHWPESRAPEEPSPAPSSFVEEWIEAGRAHEPQSAGQPGPAER